MWNMTIINGFNVKKLASVDKMDFMKYHKYKMTEIKERFIKLVGKVQNNKGFTGYEEEAYKSDKKHFANHWKNDGNDMEMQQKGLPAHGFDLYRFRGDVSIHS